MKINLSPAMNRFLRSGTSRAQINARLEEGARRVGMVGQRAVRQVIRSGVPPEQAELTAQIKGSKKPVVDSARLFKSVTYEIGRAGNKPRIILIGVMRSSDTADVARIVHNGATFAVTPKMAMLFQLLSHHAKGRAVTFTSPRGVALASRVVGKDIRPMKVGSTIVIPPRPFGSIVLRDPAFRAEAERQMALALLKGITSS